MQTLRLYRWITFYQGVPSACTRIVMSIDHRVQTVTYLGQVNADTIRICIPGHYKSIDVPMAAEWDHA